MNQVTVDILDGPLPAAAPWQPAGAGAVLTFDGVVRPEESGRLLDALDYEAYEPMASKVLLRLATAARDEHRLAAVHVWHSRGRVPVQACSFRLRIASPHRKEALAAMDAFIDAMKRDVPIWKHPVYADTPTVANPSRTPTQSPRTTPVGLTAIPSDPDAQS